MASGFWHRVNGICQRALRIDNQSVRPSVSRPYVRPLQPPPMSKAPPLQCSILPKARAKEADGTTTAEAISHTDIKRQARNAPQREQCRSNRGGEESFLSNSLSGWRPRITPRRKEKKRRAMGMALKIMNARSLRSAFLFVRGVSPSFPLSPPAVTATAAKK